MDHVSRTVSRIPREAALVARRGSRKGHGRERRYEHPIPSREAIVVAMEEAGRPLTLSALSALVGLDQDPEQRSLENRLRAMTRDGQLLRNRRREYCLTGHLDLVPGVVKAHRDGFGFLIPDDGSEDVYIPAVEMRTLWNGDRVAVRTSQSARGRQGSLVEVLERSTQEVVGKFVRERGIDRVQPDGDTNVRILIPRGKSGGARAGDVVRVDIVSHPTARADAIGHVARVIGRDDDPGIETVVAILSHGLREQWPDTARHQADEFPANVPAAAKRGRVDLRAVPLVTIDGADAKDFDDAVFCERRGDGWRLIVAIADVSHYVEPDSSLDAEAQVRGTSVYFPDRVLPMLPEALSNGLCSLRPHVDRLCLCCEMSVAESGEIRRSKFYDAVMRSAARLTYEEAAGILDGRIKGKKAAFKAQLLPLREIYGAFARRRRRRGAIDFDLPQTKIALGARGEVVDVHAVERTITHRIIEECMIAANVEAARKLRKARIPALFRVHEGPDPDKVEELVVFLQSLGMKLKSPGSIQPRDLSRIIEAASGGPEAEIVEAVILRTMSRARYQPGNIGHFGLALSSYAHFTSPIRRYPDLLVHRAIKHLSKHGAAKGYRYRRPEMERLGEQCSLAERRADEAVWQVEERLKCRYLEQHVGDEFDVLVTAVTPFGLFVRIPGLQIDGLVHVSALPGDYYHPSSGGTELRGERSGTTYRLMDELRVELVNVDVDERKLDFVPAGRERAPKRRGRRQSRG